MLRTIIVTVGNRIIDYVCHLNVWSTLFLFIYFLCSGYPRTFHSFIEFVEIVILYDVFIDCTIQLLIFLFKT